MKKVFVLILVFAFALSACDALVSPTQLPVLEPTSVPPTAEVIVVTVEVPVVVTAPPSAASPTPAPTETQPPTAAPSETSPAVTTPTEAFPTATAPTDTAPVVSVDASFLGGSFKEITYSSPSFSLRCQPVQISFTATTNDPAITSVDFYYRIEDRKGTTISEWKNLGKMQVTGYGTFSQTILGETIHPDLRKALAWFDFQLVGLSQQGTVVGRTEKIVQLVTYTIDCQ